LRKTEVPETNAKGKQELERYVDVNRALVTLGKTLLIGRRALESAGS
jgi:hypothetical protein